MTAVCERRLAALSQMKPVVTLRTWLSDALTPLLVVAAALLAVRPLSDPDVWWHLRTGELIIEQGFVTTDPWSFASAKPWHLHEWLSEVIMYSAFAVAGYSGVVALVSMTIACFVGVIAVSCRRVSEPTIAVSVTVLASFATVPSMGARPQLVSWVLLALAAPYMRTCVAERRLPWWLLPMIWAWANLHGLWLTALTLFAALIVGLAIEEGIRGWRTTARFAGFSLLAISAAAATPVGPDLLLSPFRVREYAQFVSEWDPPSISDPTTASALLLVLIVVLGWARGGTRVPPTTLSFVVAATGMGLLYMRTVPVMAIAVAPLAASALQGFSGARRSFFRPTVRLAVLSSVIALLAIPVVGPGFVRAASPNPTGGVTGTSAAAVLAATEAVEGLPGRARLLNQYELGGWLLWAARDTSPLVDGRADVYTVAHVRGYVEALTMQPGWRDFVEDADVDAALLTEAAPLAAGLQLIGWTVHYEKDGILVLLPPTPRPVQR